MCYWSFRCWQLKAFLHFVDVLCLSGLFLSVSGDGNDESLLLWQAIGTAQSRNQTENILVYVWPLRRLFRGWTAQIIHPDTDCGVLLRRAKGNTIKSPMRPNSTGFSTWQPHLNSLFQAHVWLVSFSTSPLHEFVNQSKSHSLQLLVLIWNERLHHESYPQLPDTCDANVTDGMKFLPMRIYSTSTH